jgi:hypothetical protein
MDVIRGGGHLVAHGVGGRSDLPISFPLALTAAVIALLVSFAVLAWRWPTPRINGDTAGHALPTTFARLLDARSWRGWWRMVGLLAVGFVAFASVAGPDDALNPAAGVVYVLFWVGTLIVASALLGSIWRALNPLRTIQYLISKALKHDPREGLLGGYPRWLGYWPAAISLWLFVWLELVGPMRDSTVTLRAWFGLYAVIHLVGAVLFGSRWFSRADGFEVVSTIFGRLSVLGRRSDDVRVIRSPLAGLDQLKVENGLLALVSVMLGSTAYDGISQGQWWLDVQQGTTISKHITGSLGLLVMVLLIAATFGLAAWLTGAVSGAAQPGNGWATQFAPSVVAIALGYALAHYYSLLVLVGQQTLSQLSDPQGTGANWFGTADWGISYAWVSPTFTATLQVIFVVGGHLIAIVLVHDRAVRLLPRRRAVLGQLPMLTVMVCYTLAGVDLLLSS